MDNREIYCTAFLGDKIIVAGTLVQVVSKVKEAIASKEELSQVLIFNDSTSEIVEVDFRGTKEETLAKLTTTNAGENQSKDTGENQSKTRPEPSRHVGRPKLGVIAGEVTLLPRHWEWLKSQPGGASVTLRKLVDEARRTNAKADVVRSAREATYRFMTTMAGNRNHYEDALRALYAGESQKFYSFIDDWAPDIRSHIKKLAAKAFQ